MRFFILLAALIITPKELSEDVLNILSLVGIVALVLDGIEFTNNSAKKS